MSTIGWIFLALNAVVSVWSIWVNVHTYNRHGVSMIKTPVGWIWIWQLLGVLLVLFFNLSPWHLIWWLGMGFMVNYYIGRVIMRAGYDLLSGKRWK